jgi:hypothetical protein
MEQLPKQHDPQWQALHKGVMGKAPILIYQHMAPD